MTTIWRYKNASGSSTVHLYNTSSDHTQEMIIIIKLMTNLHHFDILGAYMCVFVECGSLAINLNNVLICKRDKNDRFRLLGQKCLCYYINKGLSDTCLLLTFFGPSVNIAIPQKTHPCISI